MVFSTFSISQVLLIVGLGGLVAGGIALFGLANVLASRWDVNERIRTYALVPELISRRDSNRGRARLVRLRMRLNSLFSVFVSEELSLQLVSANWPITETEFVLIRVWLALGSFVLGWLFFQSWISGVGLAFIAYVIPPIYLNRSIQQRRIQFERQLIDVLMLMSGSVRAGYSLLQAIDMVVKEIRPPASEEFYRVRQEVSLGLSLSQALTNLTTRMQNDDLYLMVTAININTQVGGNMVTMLDAVTQTIRERIRLFGEIRVLTTQQRFNAFLLTLLPFGMGAVVSIINPAYIQRLFEPSWLCIPIGALFMTILGNIVVRRMTRIDV